jgi:hypothetical protein
LAFILRRVSLRVIAKSRAKRFLNKEAIRAITKIDLPEAKREV